MRELIEALIEKWADVIACSDDFEEQTLAAEFIDDLKALKHG